MEGQYFIIPKHGLYAAIQTEYDIRIYMAKGYLCMCNQVLYPVEILEWCFYALDTSDRESVNQQCLVGSKIWHANLAVSLDGYLWVISLLIMDNIQIWCVTETHMELITPPLTITYVANGCEGYSTNVAFNA